MSGRRLALLAIVVALFGTANWLTTPSGGQLEIKTCQPEGVLAQVSNWLYRNRFWKAQLVDVQRQAAEAENWDQGQAEIKRQLEPVLRAGDEEIRKANELIARIYAENPQLAPTLATQQAEALRRQADAIEQADMERQVSLMMRERAILLRKCERAIAGRLQING